MTYWQWVKSWQRKGKWLVAWSVVWVISQIVLIFMGLYDDYFMPLQMLLVICMGSPLGIPPLKRWLWEK